MTDTAPLVDVLERTPGVALAVLFGSASRGAARTTSDLDVGVAFVDEPASVERTALLQVALERVCRRTVDLVPLTTAPPLLRFEIARHGVLLLERTPFAWYDFRIRAIRDWWDWAPTARRMYAAAARRAAAAVNDTAATPVVLDRAPVRCGSTHTEGHDGPT